jgi:predicted acylesterase/phospholipase RssA
MLTAGFKSLFLSGGGLKVASFLGGLELLDLTSVERVYGLSAGSILAAFLTVGTPLATIKEIFVSSGWSQLFSEALHLSQLLSFRSLLDHRKLRPFLESLLVKVSISPHCTLGGLRGQSDRSFGCFFVDLHRGQLVMYTSESHPDVLLLDALVASCSLPCFFEAQRLGDRVYVDSGLFNNAPLSFIPSSREERLVCFVTNVAGRLQGMKNTGRAAPLSTALSLKMTLMTWMELRQADREAVTIFELPELPVSVHNFKVDQTNFEDLFRMGRLSVQSRLLTGEIAGALVLSALFAERCLLRYGRRRRLRLAGPV